MKKLLMKRRGLLTLIVCASLIILLSSGTIWFARHIDITQQRTRSSVNNHNTSPTVSVESTATALAHPLFFDDFTNNAHGWSVGDAPGYTRAVQGNVLTLIDTHHSILVESLPINTSFRDFSLTTTFTLAQARESDSVGLYLRGDSNLDHDYRIDIFGDNTYALSKESLNSQQIAVSTFLIPPTSSSFLNPVGQKNSLTVIMNDIELTMLLNNHLVGSITDADYAHGQIALFVNNGSTSESTTAVFYDIAIYPVLESAP